MPQQQSIQPAFFQAPVCAHICNQTQATSKGWWEQQLKTKLLKSHQCHEENLPAWLLAGRQGEDKRQPVPHLSVWVPINCSLRTLKPGARTWGQQERK